MLVHLLLQLLVQAPVMEATSFLSLGAGEYVESVASVVAAVVVADIAVSPSAPPGVVVTLVASVVAAITSLVYIGPAAAAISEYWH
jgi:hypothetical protein